MELENKLRLRDKYCMFSVESIFKYICSSKHLFLYSVCVCVWWDGVGWGHVYHSIHVQVRKQLANVSSFLPLCWFWGWNSGYKSWQQASLSDILLALHVIHTHACTCMALSKKESKSSWGAR